MNLRPSSAPGAVLFAVLLLTLQTTEVRAETSTLVQEDAPPSTGTQALRTEAPREPAVVVQIEFSQLVPVSQFVIAADARATLRLPRQHLFMRFSVQPLGYAHPSSDFEYGTKFSGFHFTLGYHGRAFEIGVVAGRQDVLVSNPHGPTMIVGASGRIGRYDHTHLELTLGFAPWENERREGWYGVGPLDRRILPLAELRGQVVLSPMFALWGRMLTGFAARPESRLELGPRLALPQRSERRVTHLTTTIAASLSHWVGADEREGDPHFSLGLGFRVETTFTGAGAP